MNYQKEIKALKRSLGSLRRQFYQTAAYRMKMRNLHDKMTKTQQRKIIQTQIFKKQVMQLLGYTKTAKKLYPIQNRKPHKKTYFIRLVGNDCNRLKQFLSRGHLRCGKKCVYRE